MSREVWKRKKRFWAFCLALIVALSNPLSIRSLAAEEDGSSTIVSVSGENARPISNGDRVSHEESLTFTSHGSVVISYYDVYDDESDNGKDPMLLYTETYAGEGTNATYTGTYEVKGYTEVADLGKEKGYNTDYDVWPLLPGDQFFKEWKIGIEEISGGVYSINFWAIPNDYTVTYTDGVENEVVFDDQKSSVPYGSSTPGFGEKNPIREGYTFNNWSPAVLQTVIGEATYTAQWKPEIYKIRYELDGGTNGSDNPEEYVYGVGVESFADATKTGHEFAGWYSDADCTIPVTSIPKDATGEKTLYAKFTEETYGITYVLNGGDEGHGNPAEYMYGVGVESFAPANKPGYWFVGWYRDAEFENQVKSISETQMGSVTLYAKFTQDVYTVTVTNGTGEGKYPESVDVIITADTAPSGMRFKEWKGTEGLVFISGNKDTTTATFTMPANDVSVMAIYEEIYTITYTDGVEDEEIFADQTTNDLTHGSATPEFKGTPTRVGYTFNGWSLEVAETVTGDATYTAQWTPISYTITIISNENGTAKSSVATATIGETVYIEAVGYPGWHLAKWETTSNGVVLNEPQNWMTYFTMPANDVTITAVFEEGDMIFVLDVNENFSDEDIPQQLRDAGFDTVDEIRNAMRNQIMDIDNYVEGTDLFDVLLMYSIDGGFTWIRADETHFPEDGKLLVTLPVPEGTDPEMHNYIVLHMFASDAFGKTVGQVEQPEVTVVQKWDGNWYLEFYVTGLSPISIGWSEKEQPSEEPQTPQEPTIVQPEAPVEKVVTSPKTGDSANLRLGFAVLFLSSICLLTVTIYGRRKKNEE